MRARALRFAGLGFVEFLEMGFRFFAWREKRTKVWWAEVEFKTRIRLGLLDANFIRLYA